MAVDAQWAYVAAMLPLSADFSDARGNATGFGNNTEILDTVGDPFGAGDAAYFAGYAAGPNFSGGSVLCGYVDLSSDFTIQLAVYPEDGGHGSADAILLQIGAADAPDSLRIIADSTDDPMRLRVARHNGAAYVDLIAVVATDIADDAWHWLQLDRVTNTFTLYVDGAQYSQATLNIYLGGENLYLGHNGSAFDLFEGYLSQVRVTQALRASHAVPTDPWPRPTITGSIMDVLGNPVSRVVRCIPRAQAVQAISDAITGVYTAYPTSYAEHIVIRIDTEDDPPIDGQVVGAGNAMVLDRVTPGG
jgi:hypothetical protein